MQSKETLRYVYRKRRELFKGRSREVADVAILNRVLKEFAGKRNFFVYYSYSRETDTHEIIARLLAAGKNVYLPRMEGKEIVPVAYVGDESALKVNSRGIAEPDGQAYAGRIDVCITPLIAVNSSGFRLGYGGGYYDRYFAAHPEVVRCGIGYAVQQTDEFEEEEFDQPLDLFICEKGTINFAKIGGNY